MRDVRIRTGIATLLSITAFFSLTGAAAAFIWWLLFSKNIRTVLKNRVILPSLILVGFFSIVLELTTGGGFSYFIRMGVIILLGTWLLCEQKPGDFLNLGQWLFGKRTGFELGMIAEMAIQSLNALMEDFQRIRIAEQLKGIRWGIQSIIPVGQILIHRTLIRAEETAELLAIRGYTCGGTRCPVFTHSTRDYIAGFFAICAAIIAIIPVRAFFILS
jgi:energy-coupling factor transporter transmembrane protein EcfT